MGLEACLNSHLGTAAVEDATTVGCIGLRDF